MVFSVLYVVLAAFGLGLLIFIHELGHYWMARREGMTVEAFSIGFGKPIYTWERKGVKWQICYLPFGGYVRIAGMEKKGVLEPYQIPDGFFGKKPWARIKVALMGPLVNIGFAFVLFCLLWVLGGRLKPFSEFTSFIGWVDPHSELYTEGVRAGDEITQVNHKPFVNFEGLLYTAIFEDTPPQITGEKIDYFEGTKTPFQYRFTYDKKAPLFDRIHTIADVFMPASYLIYSQAGSFSLDANSPMMGSGIEDGDRILWVDGELMFSRESLVQTINEPKALFTIQRGEETFLARVPRLKISDLRLSVEQRSELEDWQHEAQLKGRLSELFFIPYGLTADCVVSYPLSYLNEDTIEQQPMGGTRLALETPLQNGDRILAVDGIAVASAYEMIDRLQQRHIQIIVQEHAASKPISWKVADKAFTADIAWDQLNQMVQSIGTNHVIQRQDNLKLLSPVIPKPMSEMSLPQEARKRLEAQAAAQEKKIEEIQDPQARAQAVQLFEANRNQVKLGIVMRDRAVEYNPSPFTLFSNVLRDTWRTLLSLFTGTLSPKYMQGPVGIVTLMQQSWSSGFKEAIFWLGMISLNLGILNLLPIPVLDGGHICFSLWEWITGKPIKAKVMERLIIPFIVLLVALFIYLTYNDIVRLFSGFFKGS